MFDNPTKAEIEAFLRRIRTVAVLGLTETPGLPSHHVASELQKFGYRIVPINPGAREILGEKAWPDLEAATQGAGPIDVVDVFRPAAEAPGIAREAVALGAHVLWLQTGIVSAEAEQIATEGGLTVVMDRCMGAMHGALGLGPGPGRPPAH